MNKKLVIGIATTLVVAVAGTTGFCFYKKNTNEASATSASYNNGSDSGFVLTKNENNGEDKKENGSGDVSKSDTKGSDAKTGSVSEVVDNVMPAIVSINTETISTQDFFGRSYGSKSRGAGSGIIIGQEGKKILIATNNHVVADANSVTVVFCDDKEVSADVRGTDEGADLAVVTVDMSDMEKETKDKIKIASVGDSSKCKVGEMAIAIGNALGYGQSVTVGVVSATERQISSEDASSLKCIQTDAAINPGNSGGALLNAKGEVIGINSIKYVSEETEGIGYAIPISVAMPIINNLEKQNVASGDQAYLGIVGVDITEQYTKIYGMPKGVYVKEVAQDSPASDAGLKKGDIIVKIADRDVSTMSDIEGVLKSHHSGEKSQIVIKRESDGEYKEQTLDVTFGKNNN